MMWGFGPDLIVRKSRWEVNESAFTELRNLDCSKKRNGYWRAMPTCPTSPGGCGGGLRGMTDTWVSLCNVFQPNDLGQVIQPL